MLSGRTGMEVPIFLVITVVLIALAFDFTNGFHDAANAIATVVATKALTMKQALVMAAVLNVLGAFFATAVAETIEKGIIRDVGSPVNAQIIVLSALSGAILWNIITWYFAMPSSSSHAIVGGLVGAGVTYGHMHDIIWETIVDKVVIPMVLSPVFGLAVSGILMLLIYVVFQALKGSVRHSLFRVMQILSGALMAFSHGSNDAQKTMGVITLALIGANLIDDPSGGIPWWVILLCALAMGLGTLAGGKRIIETAGHKITKLENESGFAANIGASITILICSRLGLPVSTTHVVAGSITGAGAIANKGQVNFATWRHMATAWILTLPGAAGLAMVTYLVLERFVVPRLG